MDVSIFLAKVIGLYFVIVSLLLLLNPERFRLFSEKFLENEIQIFSTALFTLILGILMVVSHNVWVYDWRVFVTVIGWITLIKGILLLLSPSFFFGWAPKFYNRVNLRFFGVLYLLIGFFFCWKGFNPPVATAWSFFG